MIIVINYYRFRVLEFKEPWKFKNFKYSLSGKFTRIEIIRDKYFDRDILGGIIFIGIFCRLNNFPIVFELEKNFATY